MIGNVGWMAAEMLQQQVLKRAAEATARVSNHGIRRTGGHSPGLSAGLGLFAQW